MKAFILNSGMGRRMGALTSEQPKCMTKITDQETILSRQLHMAACAGIKEAVITTGYFDSVLTTYCENLHIPIQISFVKNPDFAKTNYIYSIYCAREAVDDDIILMHGDMVFERAVFEAVLASVHSCMTVSSSVKLPQKDFKAVIKDGRIQSIGIEYFENAAAAQPLYKLFREDWRIWLNRIISYCENNNRKCYAENAFNEVSDRCRLYPLDVGGRLCNEVDNVQDLAVVSKRLREIARKKQKN